MPRHVTRRDLLPAILLAAAATAEALYNDAVNDGTAVPAAFAALMSLPFAVRRIAPLAALLATWIVYDIQEATVGTLSEGALPFIVLVLAMYAAASRLTGRALAIAIVASYVGVGVSIALDAGGADIDSATYGALVVTAALASGRLLGGRQRTIEALALERDQVVREQETVAREAAERERTRIAYELHDIITHRVSAMVLQASSERRAVELGSPAVVDGAQAIDTLRSIEQLGRDAMVELRHLLGALHHHEDAPRAPQPDVSRIASLVAETARAGHPVLLRTSGTARPVPAGAGLSAYRIVQEALSNALRHAPGAPTSVDLAYEDDWIEVRVTNESSPEGRADGRRRIVEGLGMGLAGMHERVALFGGVLHAGTTPDHGFEVVARLPLREDAA